MPFPCKYDQKRVNALSKTNLTYLTYLTYRNSVVYSIHNFVFFFQFTAYSLDQQGTITSSHNIHKDATLKKKNILSPAGQMFFICIHMWPYFLLLSCLSLLAFFFVILMVEFRSNSHAGYNYFITSFSPYVNPILPSALFILLHLGTQLKLCWNDLWVCLAIHLIQLCMQRK